MIADSGAPGGQLPRLPALAATAHAADKLQSQRTRARSHGLNRRLPGIFAVRQRQQEPPMKSRNDRKPARAPARNPDSPHHRATRMHGAVADDCLPDEIESLSHEGALHDEDDVDAEPLRELANPQRAQSAPR